MNAQVVKTTDLQNEHQCLNCPISIGTVAIMAENDSQSNELLGYSRSQLKKKRKRERDRLNPPVVKGNFEGAMRTLQNDLANHFFVASNMFPELTAAKLQNDLADHFFMASNMSTELTSAKEMIKSLVDTVRKQENAIGTLRSALERYNSDFREQLTNLIIVETLVENSLTDSTAKEEKIHTLENTVEALQAECKEYKLTLSSSLGPPGFPQASGGIEVEALKAECKEYKLILSSALAALGFPQASGGIEGKIDIAGYPKIFVGNVPHGATEGEIRLVFEEHGNVIEIIFIKDRKTGQKQECCFVKYASSDEAERAIKALDKKRTLSVALGPIEVRYADRNRERLCSFRSGFEEIRKCQEPLLRCIQENRQMSQELKTLRMTLESCKGQEKLSEENQELKTKLNEMEDYNKKLVLKEKMSTHKLEDAQDELLSLKNELDQMEGCNQYLMLKEQTSTHKLDEANNELLTLKTKLHEMEENLDSLNKQLEVTREAIEDMEDDNNVYVVKFGECNNQLQEVRKELISGLQGILNGRTIIGIKRMGELKQQPFRDVCSEKFSNAERDWKSAEQCSFWQERIKDPQWFPFRVIESDGKCEEIINENDDELKKLKNEWGDQVYEAICGALAEVNEYNPSARYPVLELWNFKEDRKAQLKEVIQYLLKLAKKKPRRR